jgi:hypothetical protein
VSEFQVQDGSAVVWKPLPKQLLALRCPAFETLFGGAKGGGKTDFLVACWLDILQLAQEKYERTGRLQKKCRIVVFRRHLGDLNDWINKSFEIYPVFDARMGVAGYNKNERKWHFSSGATVECAHLEGPEDYKHWNGQELIGVGFDEVQQIKSHEYRFIVSQVRSGDPDYYKARRVRCTANPGGEPWIVQHFGIDQHPDGGRIVRVEVTNQDGSKHEVSRCFIRSWLQDNPHLPPDYEASLRAIYNEDEVAIYLGGDFDRVAGAYFSSLLRPQIHFVKSFPIPDSWEMGAGVDWGSTNPACTEVGALDQDDTLYVIDELHTPGVTGRKYGEHMAKLWANQKWCKTKKWANDEFYLSIDKQAMDRYGSETTAADGICEWGFRLFPAEKDRSHGCNQMKERLLLNRQGNPRVVVFEDRCPRLKEALSKIESDAPSKPEEYQPKSEYSHAIDSFRFLCMRFPVQDIQAVDPRDKAARDWDRFLAASRMKQQHRNGTDDSSLNGTGYE